MPVRVVVVDHTTAELVCAHVHVRSLDARAAVEVLRREQRRKIRSLVNTWRTRLQAVTPGQELRCGGDVAGTRHARHAGVGDRGQRVYVRVYGGARVVVGDAVDQHAGESAAAVGRGVCNEGAVHKLRLISAAASPPRRRILNHKAVADRSPGAATTDLAGRIALDQAPVRLTGGHSAPCAAARVAHYRATLHDAGKETCAFAARPVARHRAVLKHAHIHAAAIPSLIVLYSAVPVGACRAAPGGLIAPAIDNHAVADRDRVALAINPSRRTFLLYVSGGQRVSIGQCETDQARAVREIHAPHGAAAATEHIGPAWVRDARYDGDRRTADAADGDRHRDGHPVGHGADHHAAAVAVGPGRHPDHIAGNRNIHRILNCACRISPRYERRHR